MTWHFLLKSLYISIFCRKLSLYLFFLECKLYFYFFFLFFGFIRVSMSFPLEHFGPNIYYGNILLRFGLEWVKIKKMFFFLHISNKYTIQNSRFIQLRLVFHKTVKKCNWNGSMRGKVSLFLSLFFPAHINFQYKLNSHISLFIVTVNYFLLLL